MFHFCVKVHFTWAWLDYDAHSPPDRVEVQYMEKLKPKGQTLLITKLILFLLTF